MMVYSIVVTYNGAQWIDKCFGSLVESQVSNHVILAIDNNSTDGTPDLIRKKFPQVKVIETGSNLGFGKANNLGIKKAIENKADYIFLLNQDAWIESCTINDLIDIQKENPQFGILSPVHKNYNGQLELNFFKYVRNNYDFVSSISIKNFKKELIECDFINAAIWLISKDCVSNVGLFNPMFPHYGEDTNYVHRLKYHGYKLGVHLNAFATHARNQDYVSKFAIENAKLRKRILITYFVVLMNINLNFQGIITSLLFEFKNMLKNCISKRKFMGTFYVISIFIILPFFIRKIYIQRKISKTIY